ncbi:DUF7594 domain-containing protein [Cerasicoccus fimbriatus]|uniref:CBM96 family carbohydrate-binding protein n=1 Tax=Cerasicoccus fimbriatus TaxID=3014554 RepID=UPI0022B2C910|nr:DNRLRE domain-containing protein [Cerasicoccus sp. TK19100]
MSKIITPARVAYASLALALNLATSYAQPTPPLPGSWTLTFEENFDGSNLDGDQWRVGQHYPGIAGSGGTDPEQITLEDGALKITAAEKPTVYGGTSYNYACGEISTFKLFKQKYGYFECRMRYHAVQGMWPAFWLMPDRAEYGWDGKYRESYLKFDLSSVTAGSVSSAVLKLTPTNVESSGGQPNILVKKCADDSWTETGLNWNNRPTPDPLYIDQLYGTSVLVANTTVDVDVTDYINQELAGDETASFALVDSFMRSRTITLASREHGTTSYRPQLVIDGQTIYPSADAYALKSAPTTNYGTQTTLLVSDAYGNFDTAHTFGDGNEVDIMESLGRWGPDRTQHAVHWDGYSTSHKSVDSGHIAYPGDGDDYHTYGLYWESGRYEFYVDGVKTYEWVNAEVMETEAFIILSLQLGGWDGSVIEDVDGRSLEVDYVRAWSGTKSGTATPGGGEGPAPTYTTVSVDEDVYVRAGDYADNNYGSEVELLSKTLSDMDYTRQTYLKFDVSSLDPHSERIELVLDPVVGPSPIETRIYVKECDVDSWSESTITFNNKPGYVADMVNSRRMKTTDTDFVIDITNYAREQINGDGTMSIVIHSEIDGSYTRFHSRESTTGNAPYLRATLAPAGSSNYIVLNLGDMSGYSTQDSGSGSVSGDGLSVTLSGNTWKKFPLSYAVTSDTVLQFTVEGSDAGEIIGIGLDENNDYQDNVRVVALGGSQIWTGAYAIDPADQYTAGSGPVSYEIPLGSIYTGSMSYLVFVGDDDANASTSITFSNIELIED